MSMDWYYELMRDDEEGNEDFEGCPSCLGGDIEKVSDVFNGFGNRARLFKCNDCGQRWEEVETTNFKGD